MSINTTIKRLVSARHIAVTTIATFCIAAATLVAATDVTFVLNNGERHSGQLVYHKDLNIGLVQNGNERSFPVSQVAAILYNDGDPGPSELAQLPTSDSPPELERHMLVLRDGRVLHGKVYHWDTDSVIFDTTAGRGTYNASDVARLFLSGPPARNVFRSVVNQPVAGNNGQGRGYGRGRVNGQNQWQSTVHVEATQRWTDTGLMVQSGERVAFGTTGTIEFGKGMSTGPDGDKNLGPRPGYAIRDMPVGGLIGRVGTGTPFAIGSSSSPIAMPAAGRLSLGVNDDGYSDNSGGYDVQIYRR